MYLVIEGNIGSGKTTLCTRISRKLNFEPVFENFQDNPFLKDFYHCPKNYASQVEQHFLIERFTQLKNVFNEGNINTNYVADFGFFRSLIFASATLSSSELSTFKREYDNLSSQLKQPDICIFLKWPVNGLLQNIKKRGREFEKGITIDYLKRVENEYMAYLKNQKDFPVIQIMMDSPEIMDKPWFFQKIVEILEQNSTFIGYNTIKL